MSEAQGTTGRVRRIDAPPRPRPPMFRALGASEPPGELEIGGRPHRLVRVFKHDSWAATALYEGEGGLVVCKFNRVQPIGFVPMGWLGRRLATNERTILQRLDDVPNVPRWSGDVRVGGRVLRNAVAHEFVPGRPLGREMRMGEVFFAELREVLDEMHRRGMAYVDLHKRENILVGDDGRPHLIDFQISFATPDGWVRHTITTRLVRRIFQRSDDYHLLKHVARDRRPPGAPDSAEVERQRPWWIRLHRWIARPIRAARRGLLTRLRVRDRSGKASSEVFAEEAVRLEAAEPAGARDRGSSAAA